MNIRNKIKTANIPFGPYAAVLAGATVNGKPNYAAIGAYGVVSQKPVLYISLKNTHCTTAGVQETGYFSVNIPTSDLVSKTDYCGLVTGKDTDKSGVFTSFYDEAGNAPMIEECSVNYLCKVIQTIPVFDFTMFLGEIVSAYAREDCIENGWPNGEKADPVILMGTGYFCLDRKIGTVFQSGKEYVSNRE